jgi:hypothetical protein
MEGGSLFNPGFLGGGFNWWIGQIADDSAWRDNIVPSKFENKDSIPGWGRRYKVRIIGLHDREETSIPSDQLPWAQVMYPTTAGGGQAAASQTSNLRQGMFVFGFFMDGQEQQVPVIMGILGNNAQTVLGTTVGTDKSNFSPTSGYATPANGDKDTNIKVPDEGLVTNKPKSPEQSKECSPPPSGVSVNKYGLRPDLPLTKAQFQDQQSAIIEADARGLTGSDRTNFIQSAVSKGIQDRCSELNSPTSPTRPGATRENADAVHEVSVADVKRNDLYQKKTILVNPCDMVGSALKAIKTILDNLTSEIDKILHAAQSYIDAASSIISDIKALIADAACQIAKYMKVVFDKIMEYILKLINKSLSKTVQTVPPNQRYKYLDIKDKITEIITCLYSKITNSLCGQIDALLNDKLNTTQPSSSNSSPNVDICSVEDLTGEVISINMPNMESEFSKIINNVNAFLSDIQDELAQASGILSFAGSSISGITGSITSALSFENIKLNIFGCDLKPNCAASDYYTLQNGSGAAEQGQLPRISQVDKSSQKSATGKPVKDVPFATPPKSTTTLKANR